MSGIATNAHVGLRSRTALSRVLLVLCWLAPVTVARAQPCQYTYRLEEFQARGHLISVEVYKPKDTARHPLLLMIHGTAGVYTREPGFMPEDDNFGEKTFAVHCYIVILPHYFDAFGKSSITNPEEAGKAFPQSRAVLENILKNAASLSSVQGCPVLVYGESFGGFLAVSLGFREPRILAVSEFSGGLPVKDMEPQNSSLSLLIQHGTDDSLVPISNAVELEKYAVVHGAKVEKHLYAGQGHYFDAATQKAVLNRTLAFFDRIIARRNSPFQSCK